MDVSYTGHVVTTHLNVNSDAFLCGQYYPWHIDWVLDTGSVHGLHGCKIETIDFTSALLDMSVCINIAILQFFVKHRNDLSIISSGQMCQAECYLQVMWQINATYCYVQLQFVFCM